MSKAPSMPMFWDAYLADSTHLTTEEHGAYLLLLAAMWRRNGWVPDNDKDNARILGLTVAKWRKTKTRLSEFLTYQDGHITQKNLLKIWKNTQEKIRKNKENGAKGGRPKSSENNGLAKANGSVSDNPNESIPEPKKEKDSINTIQKENSVDFDLEFAETFWPQYPRKVDKERALKAFRAARRKVELSDIMAGLLRYSAERVGQDEKFTKHARTWLNNKCWLNESALPGKPSASKTVRSDSPEFMKILFGECNAANPEDEADLRKAIEGTARQNAEYVRHAELDRAAFPSVSQLN